MLNRIKYLQPIKAVTASNTGPVYLVGGSVRDLLLGRDLHDLDLVIEHDPEGTAVRASEKLGTTLVTMGEPPLVTYRFAHQGLIVDICPQTGGDILTDLMRRDLTVNAMAWRLDDTEGEIIDPTGGRADLNEKTARFISEANVIDDPLRMLRLFRFSGTIGLTPSPESLALVQRHAALIVEIAGERIREELLQFLSVTPCGDLIREMLATGLLESLIPELSGLRNLEQGSFHHVDALDHTLLALESLETIMADPEAAFPDWGEEIHGYFNQNRNTSLLKLAILLHDLGKASTRTEDVPGEVHFIGHEKISESMAMNLAKRFRLSIDETGILSLIIRDHLHLIHLFEAEKKGQLTSKGIYRFGRASGGQLWGLVLHTWADNEATQGPAQRVRGGPAALIEFLNHVVAEIYRQRATLNSVDRLINGHDLMKALDISPSPLVGKLLNAIEEALATETITGREQALELARQILRNEPAEITD